MKVYYSSPSIAILVALGLCPFMYYVLQISLPSNCIEASIHDDSCIVFSHSRRRSQLWIPIWNIHVKPHGHCKSGLQYIGTAHVMWIRFVLQRAAPCSFENSLKVVIAFDLVRWLDMVWNHLRTHIHMYTRDVHQSCVLLAQVLCYLKASAKQLSEKGHHCKDTSTLMAAILQNRILHSLVSRWVLGTFTYG